MSAGGSGTGNAPKSYNPSYGGIPQLPAYTTDTTTTTGTDVQAQMLQNLPGYAGMSAADSGNIQSNLSGQLSPDVISLMQQQAAERGVSTGSPGSANTDAAYLRALGLTSLQLENLGHSQLTEAMGRTPIQQTQTGTQTHDLSAMQAIYNAAPVPAAAAAEALRLAQYGMGQGRAMAGGGGGGGGYGGTRINPAQGPAAGSNMTSPSPNYGSGGVYGATGVGGESMYPGYKWNANTGQYEQIANTQSYSQFSNPTVGNYFAGTQDQYDANSVLDNYGDYGDYYGY